MSYTVGEPWVVEPVEWGAPLGQKEYIQRLNREHARVVMREWIDTKRREMEQEIAELEKRVAEGCDFCRGLPIGSGYDLKYGCGKMYGLLLREDTAACPKCERIVASWD